MIGLVARIVIGLVGGLLLVLAMACAIFGEFIRDVAARRRTPTQFQRNRSYVVESYQTSVTEVQ
jgi:hypothetical protein